MPRPLVFISHITEESSIALAFRDVIQDAFLGLFEVFVSSDQGSIRTGDHWLDKISEALKTCVIEFVLCSPTSITRPWINFEAGAGWVRGIPVVPLCHSGLTPNRLPIPLNMLQGATATAPKELVALIPRLAGVIGANSPTVNFDNFVQIVKEFEKQYTFWNAVQQNLRALDSHYTGLPDALKKMALERLPEITIEQSGNWPQAFQEATEYFELQEVFQLYATSSGTGFGDRGAVSVGTWHVRPLRRFQEVCTAQEFTTSMK